MRLGELWGGREDLPKASYSFVSLTIFLPRYLESVEQLDSFAIIGS